MSPFRASCVRHTNINWHRLKDFIKVTVQECLIKCMLYKITASIRFFLIHCTVKNYRAYIKHPSCGWILGYVQYLPYTIASAAFVARKTARACLVSENLFPNFADCLKIEFEQKKQLAEKLI